MQIGLAAKTAISKRYRTNYKVGGIAEILCKESFSRMNLVDLFIGLQNEFTIIYFH